MYVTQAASHLGCAEGPSRYRSLGRPTGSQRPRCTWELSSFQQKRQQRGPESPSDTTLPCTFLGWAPKTLRVADRKGALGHLLSPACGAAAGSLACQASPTEQVGRAALRGTSAPSHLPAHQTPPQAAKWEAGDVIAQPQQSGLSWPDDNNHNSMSGPATQERTCSSAGRI